MAAMPGQLPFNTGGAAVKGAATKQPLPFASGSSGASQSGASATPTDTGGTPQYSTPSPDQLTSGGGILGNQGNQGGNQSSAIPTGYVKVRDYLTGQGVPDNLIGFDPNTQTVTVNGQDYYTGNPSQNVGGHVYADPMALPNVASFLPQNQIPQGNYYQQGLGVLQQLQNAYNQPLDIQNSPEYNAIQSAAQSAAQQSGQAAMENLNSRGFLNSSQTPYEVGQAYAQANAQALPQEIAAAQQARQQNLQGLSQLFGAYQGLGQQQYQQQLQQEQARLQAQQQELQNAWQGVQSLGYVDNNAAVVLGVPAGTPSFDAQKAYEALQAANARANATLQSGLARAQATEVAASIRGPSRVTVTGFGPSGNLTSSQALALWKATGVSQGVPGVPDGTPYQNAASAMTNNRFLYSQAESRIKAAQAVGQQPDPADLQTVQQLGPVIQAAGQVGAQGAAGAGGSSAPAPNVAAAPTQQGVDARQMAVRSAISQGHSVNDVINNIFQWVQQGKISQSEADSLVQVAYDQQQYQQAQNPPPPPTPATQAVAQAGSAANPGAAVQSAINSGVGGQ